MRWTPIIHRPQSAAELRAKMPLAARIKLCLDLASFILARSTISMVIWGILYPYLTHPEPSGFNYALAEYQDLPFLMGEVANC